MRILLINQFFWPDSAATSQLLTDVARELQERGHEVFAIASEGGYAPANGEDPPPVAVHRVKGLKFVRGSLGRISSYASFFIGCAWHGLTLPRPDVVLTLTTPPLISVVGTLIKRFRGSQHFIWEMDVYPDVAVDVGYFKRGGILDRISGMLADFSRKRSDGILALGECMRRRLINRGLPPENIHVAENWADSKLVQRVPPISTGNQLILLYSGNLGLAHDLETLTAAIKILKDDTEFRFIVAGSGPKRPFFEEWCRAEQIQSVEFRGYAQRDRLSDSLAAGDIGLVTQRESCLGSVVPSKVYGLLAAGRPVLFIGPQESTAAAIIRRFGCGWHISNGDVTSLIGLLRQLSADKTLVERAGQRAREAFLGHYDRPAGVSRIVDLIGAARKRATPQPAREKTLCMHL